MRCFLFVLFVPIVLAVDHKIVLIYQVTICTMMHKNKDVLCVFQQALRNIVADINYPDISDEILSLWLAYEEQRSLEAQIAHQLDKLEMIIQANEYEKAHGKELTSFFTSTENDFHHPEVLAWATAVREERRVRLASKQ